MSFHIKAKPGEIADRILLPGDPLRAKFIAETFFKDPVCFNQVRGMLGFTGTVDGMRVSVMGTGMGQPSLSIYVNELLREYGVKKLIRVGTCGSIQDHVKLLDIVLALSASTDSGINRIRFNGIDYAPSANFHLLSRAHAAALKAGIAVHAGPILSSDSFYAEDSEQWRLWAKFGVLAVEMECAELYTLAAKFKAEALGVLTVSDNIVTGEATSSEDRERTLKSMILVALEAIRD